MANAPVLVVDDEQDICKLIGISLDRIGISSVLVNTLAHAVSALEQQTFSMCLTDMRLPDGDGLELVSHIAKTSPGTPVAMITAHGNMDIAIDALKRGAYDFLTKPIDLSQLQSMVQSATTMEPATEQSDVELLERRLVGRSSAIVELRQLIIKVARSQAPVFISGESGAGKEVCARCIHTLSSRKDYPFVAVNCGAIPSELVESEFFGHKKGSFTGADKDKKGLFESATSGTLMLDEIADLPLSMQVKLLRAIQEKSVRPIGSNEESAIDVRLLSATHKNLQQLVNDGQFRDDLFYRINVIELNVPPLRDRREDIPDLSAHILAKLARQGSKASLTDSAIDRLSEYNFPGNIRELENTLERSIALCEDDEIDSDDLVFQKSLPNTKSPTELSAALSTAPSTAAVSTRSTDAVQPEGGSFAKTHDSAAPAMGKPPRTADSSRSSRDGPLDEYLENIEREEILAALESCRWNRTEAAKLLGMSFRSLRYRLNKLGIDG